MESVTLAGKKAPPPTAPKPGRGRGQEDDFPPPPPDMAADQQHLGKLATVVLFSKSKITDSHL